MAEGTQQHPLKIYFFVWILLFVFSAFSYGVDYLQFEGFTRWGLILLFMLLKAGFICAIFMHMFWERLHYLSYFDALLCSSSFSFYYVA